MHIANTLSLLCLTKVLHNILGAVLVGKKIKSSVRDKKVFCGFNRTHFRSHLINNAKHRRKLCPSNQSIVKTFQFLDSTNHSVSLAGTLFFLNLLKTSLNELSERGEARFRISEEKLNSSFVCFGKQIPRGTLELRVTEQKRNVFTRRQSLPSRYDKITVMSCMQTHIQEPVTKQTNDFQLRQNHALH